MGTSASAKGSGRDQPLVPPWADDEPGEPIPVSPEKRFQAFRRAFGSYLKSGNPRDLQRSLGHYARTATGGRSVGPRRYGSVYATGGDLYSILSSLGGDGTLADSQGLSKASLTGQPLDVVCQRLSEALTPSNGDADRIRESIDQAMIEVLGDQEFDPTSLDDETIQRILGEYLSQAVFQEIVEEVGGSWSNGTATSTPEAEAALLEAIRAVVEVNFSPKLEGKINIVQADIRAFMRETINEVWATWEEYSE
jgi:hypothetical protein